MRILIVRHADPDYEIDSLTPKGWKEAELLSKRLIKYDLNGIYCSPLGRACDTAGVTLKKLNREAEICDWLREFDVPVRLPNGEMKGNCWDLMPSYWTGIEKETSIAPPRAIVIRLCFSAILALPALFYLTFSGFPRFRYGTDLLRRQAR